MSSITKNIFNNMTKGHIAVSYLWLNRHCLLSFKSTPAKAHQYVENTFIVIDLWHFLWLFCLNSLKYYVCVNKYKHILNSVQIVWTLQINIHSAVVSWASERMSLRIINKPIMNVPNYFVNIIFSAVQFANKGIWQGTF